MKVYNPKLEEPLNAELKKALEEIRVKRGFDAKKYLNAKASILNLYMRKFNLKSCVVAVSGGIDSAIVLGIVNHASKQKDSPIKKIVALLLPIVNSKGITNQADATKRGEEVCRVFNITPTIIDLSEVNFQIRDLVEPNLNIPGENWAIGQLGPYTRTPILYYSTSLLSQAGFPALICGTTNKDEGAYLGYVGKASDGMVDVQLISDIHKSEVYKVGKELLIPQAVMQIKPNGDMYDNRTDEEVFGAAYDFVELYLNYLNFEDSKKEEFLNKFEKKAKEQFLFFAANLENLHRYNFHKYLAKSPAVHLDLYESAVKGGWDNNSERLWDILGIANFNLKLDNLDLFGILNLGEDSTKEEVDSAYKNLKVKTREARIAWKVLRDKFYSQVYKKSKSFDKVKEAGFFDDKLEEDYPENLELLTTPINKILANLKNNQNSLVLVSTGGFSPLHDGHLEMMELAKKALEEKGFNVVGGYFSPSHDDYVLTKPDNPMPAAERIALCQEAVKDSDWLMIDPWEARYVKTSVNFTEVIIRLEKYLQKHVNKKIKVVCVFGSDNAGFMRCFENEGYGACINRAGFRVEFEKLRAELEGERRVFIDNPNKTAEFSSRVLRKNNYQEYDSKIEQKGSYIIRDEGLLPLKWAGEKEELALAQQTFLQEVKSIFRKNIPDNVTLRIIDLQEQLEYATSMLKNKKVISLDPYFKSEYNLEVSRVFALSEGQHKPWKLVNRPGKNLLSEQAKIIPAGEYILVDDDSVSGETFRRISALLTKDVKIKDYFLLSKFIGENIFDAVDLRDFLIGAENGGLVIELPNKEIVRVPYMLPYVSLVTRAKIPPKNEFDMSLALWNANKRFFNSLEEKIKLNQVSPDFQKLMAYLGFKQNAGMEEICDWHIARLLEAKNGGL